MLLIKYLMSTGEQIAAYDFDSSLFINTIEVSSNDKFIILGGNQGCMFFFSIDKGNLIASYDTHETITSLAISNDNVNVFAGHSNGKISKFFINESPQIYIENSIIIDKVKIMYMTITNDNKYLFASNLKYQLFQICIVTKKIVIIYNAVHDNSSPLTLSPNSKSLFTLGFNKNILQISIEKRKIFRAIGQKTNHLITCIILRKNANYVVAAYEDGRIL